MWLEVNNPRLSFINKEKDFESLLGDFGVRKYEDGLGRFTTCDPLFEKYYGWSPYVYCGNNPINIYDNNGKWWTYVHYEIVFAAFDWLMIPLTNNQKEMIKAGNNSMDIGKNNDDKHQYLHCLVTQAEVDKYGYEQAVSIGKSKLETFISQQEELFLMATKDEEYYYLAKLVHSIADLYCPQHQWGMYGGVFNVIGHTAGEGWLGGVGGDDYDISLSHVQQRIEELFYKKRQRKIQEQALEFLHIDRSESDW